MEIPKLLLYNTTQGVAASQRPLESIRILPGVAWDDPFVARRSMDDLKRLFDEASPIDVANAASLRRTTFLHLSVRRKCGRQALRTCAAEPHEWKNRQPRAAASFTTRCTMRTVRNSSLRPRHIASSATALA